MLLQLGRARPRSGLTAYVDVGGFGVGAHRDWQLLGTIDYAPKPWLDLQLGYRTVNFNYTRAAGSIWASTST